MAKSKAKLIVHDSAVRDAAFEKDFVDAIEHSKKGGILSFAIVIEHLDRSVSTSWRTCYRGDRLRLGGALEKVKLKVLA